MSAVSILVAALGVAVALMALYQLLLAVAAFGYRAADGSGPLRTRLAVLVPAHDEAALIGRCVESLLAQSYPRALYDVVVVADNCADETAAVAAAAGADVLVRDEPDRHGKGRALRWAQDPILARTPAPDAIVVVDADSVAAPEFLASLVRPFETGAPAVQGESLLIAEASPAAAFRATAFLLVNRTRPRGKSVLGLPCTLAGNGMLLGTALLRAHPWDAFTSAEDLEFSINLRRAGVRPAFAGGAILHSPAAPNPQAAAEQQLRWEGGKLHVARTHIPGLVAAALRERRPSLLEAAFELAVPPLGLLAALATFGAALAALLVALDILAAWALAPWLAAVAAIPAYVLIGLRAAHAPSWAYRSIGRAPLFVLRKLLGLRRLSRFRPDTWVRTKREE